MWAVIGVGFGFAVSVIGLITVPASALVALFLIRRPRLRESAWGALVGIGAVPLAVAYMNRHGPGTVCHTFDNGRGTQCDELLDPRTWLAVGLAFIAAGVIGQVLRLGSADTQAPTS